jgi:hypothetical protein
MLGSKLASMLSFLERKLVLDYLTARNLIK